MDETEKTKARVQLAIMYERGDGVQRSFKEAAYWYKLAADDQHPLALAALGRLYARGRGVEQDLDAAIALLSRASDLGDAKSARILRVVKRKQLSRVKATGRSMAVVGSASRPAAREETRVSEMSEAQPTLSASAQVAQLAQRAKENDVQAMIELGDYYLRAEEARDEEKAITWYTRAVHLNSREAKTRLAELHLQAGKQNYLRAIDRYIAAVRLGSSEALDWCLDNDASHPKLQLFAAALYLAGDGVRRNRPRAVALLQKAMKAGSQEAASALEELQIQASARGPGRLEA